MQNGDLLQQTTFDVTGTAKYLFGPYSTGEAKDPVNIIIQNNDAAGIVYVNLSGVATVSSSMLMIRPSGGIMEFKNIVNAVSVIGSISSNVVACTIVRNKG